MIRSISSKLRERILFSIFDVLADTREFNVLLKQMRANKHTRMCIQLHLDSHTVYYTLYMAFYSMALYIKHSKHADVSQQAEIVRLLRSIARARNTSNVYLYAVKRQDSLSTPLR